MKVLLRSMTRGGLKDELLDLFLLCKGSIRFTGMGNATVGVIILSIHQI